MNTPGEPDELETLMSGSVGGTRKPTVAIQQGSGCLPYDITVIYLFLEGELVGEAYCTQYLNRRVSWWEAQAERRSDAALKEAATAESLENRQEIQQKVAAGKRIHSLETKRLEKQRQLDRQRQEIHPEHVQQVLQVLAKEQAAPPTRPPVSRLLAPAVPKEDPPGTPIEHLPIRDLRGDGDVTF
jgi:hypothetical protein